MLLSRTLLLDAKRLQNAYAYARVCARELRDTHVCKVCADM